MGKRVVVGLAGLVVAIAVALFASMSSTSVPTRGGASMASADIAMGEEGEQEGLGPAEPDEWFLAQRAGGPGKTINQNDVSRAVAQAQALRGSSAPRQIRGTWELAGPTNV